MVLALSGLGWIDWMGVWGGGFWWALRGFEGMIEGGGMGDSWGGELRGNSSRGLEESGGERRVRELRIRVWRGICGMTMELGAEGHYW